MSVVSFGGATFAATSSSLGFPILTSLVVVPLLGSLCVLFFGRVRSEWNRPVALMSSITTGALSVWMLQAFDSTDAGFQFVSRHEWISAWGI